MRTEALFLLSSFYTVGTGVKNTELLQTELNGKGSSREPRMDFVSSALGQCMMVIKATSVLLAGSHPINTVIVSISILFGRGFLTFDELP